MIVPRRQALSPSHTPPEPTTSSPTRGFRSDLENLELAAGTAARVVSPGVELIALFVADDVPDGSFAPGATARAVTVAVAQEDGQWLVTGLHCVAVPGWPPTW